MREPGCRSLAIWISLIAGVTLWATSASAQQVFQVPADCGSRDEFVTQVERLLGGPAPGLEPSLLTIRAGYGGASFHLRLEQGAEVRELVDASCQTLFRSAVVIVAAAARGEALQRDAEEVPSLDLQAPAGVPGLPSVARTAPPLPAAPPRHETADFPRDRSVVLTRRRVQHDGVNPLPAIPATRPGIESSPPLAGELGVVLGAVAGTVPAVAPALGLDAGLSGELWGLRVSALYWPGTDAESRGRAVFVRGLGARVAAVTHFGAVVRAAAGLEVRRLEGSGRRVSGSTTDAVWDAAPHLECAANVLDYSHLHLEVAAFGSLSLGRPHFQVAGFGDVYRVPRVGGGAMLRILYRSR